MLDAPGIAPGLDEPRGPRSHFRRDRAISLLSSRSHTTELATVTQNSQSPALKAAVENACCRNET
jgi:hypothetical protein